MALETDFNVTPYYDDYDESKDYHKVLFKPAVALQARELTQLQTILQNQVEKFGSYVFKERSIVKGCVFNFSTNIEYVKLQDQTIAGTDLNVALISEGDYIRGQTANLVSRVVDTASGLESQNPDFGHMFDSDIDFLSHTYSTPGIKTIKSSQISFLKYITISFN